MNDAAGAEHLGIILLYNITSGSGEEPLPVTREELRTLFAELDLDLAFMPVPVRGVEAFRAATTGLGDEWISGGTRYKVVVRETKRTEEYVLRQMFAQWSTPSGPQERRVADLQFFRPRRVTAGRVPDTEKLKTMMHSGLQDLDRARLKALVETCKIRYDLYKHRMSPHLMRTLVRQYLVSLGAVSLRSGTGGAYFLPMDQLDHVRRLRELVTRSGPQCRMVFTPVVNGEEQRDMMRDAVELDVTSRCEQLISDMDDWVRRNPDRRPSALSMQSWRGEYVALTDLLHHYAGVLEGTFEQAGNALDQVDAALRELDRVAADSLRKGK